MSVPSEVLTVMVEPGYYANDPRRFSLGEFHRMSGGGFVGFFRGLFRGYMTFFPNFAMWLPIYWEDTLASPEEISERGMEAILTHIAEFEREGFRMITYQKLKTLIWPSLVENCGAILIHTSGEFIATVGYNELLSGKTTLSKTIEFSYKLNEHSGVWITVTDVKAYFDPVRPSRIISMPGSSTQSLWRLVKQERKILAAHGQSINCFTEAQWKKAYNQHLASGWHDQINVRKIYRKLTDTEVENLRRQAANH